MPQQNKGNNIMIIGLTGVKGAGKDEAAKVLKGFEILKMAGALKDMLRALLSYQNMDKDTIERMIEGDLKEIPSKKYLGGKSPRQAMQFLGTEFGRNLINKNLWINSTMEKAKNFENVKFTDIRFANEHQAVKDAGGVTIRIERETKQDENSMHASELEIMELPVDFVIKNNGTIEELHSEMSVILEMVRNGQY